MGMARHSHPAVGERGVEKLPMAAFLASKYPALLMEPLENLTNFHSTTVPGRTRGVNAERCGSVARRQKCMRPGTDAIGASTEAAGFGNHFTRIPQTPAGPYPHPTEFG